MGTQVTKSFGKKTKNHDGLSEFIKMKMIVERDLKVGAILSLILLMKN